MSGYPFQIITDYRAGKISRAEFCERYAALQGYNGSVKGYANHAGVFVEYRNRRGKIDGDVITWQENGQQHTARSFKEFKIKIDILEIKAVPESAVVDEVKKIIKATGLKVQRINTGCFQIGTGKNRRYIKTAEAGTCDFEGYDMHGRFLAIECKRPVGGKLSPAQPTFDEMPPANEPVGDIF